MGRIKNIRLNKVFSLCLVSCLVFNSVMIRAYAESDNYVISDSTDIIDNISDINNIENLGNTYTINAKTICVYDEYILVNDGTGEIWVFLDGITVNNIENEDDIFVVGTIIQVNDKILISVNDIDNIGLIIEEEEPVDEPIIPDDSEMPNEDNSSKPEESTEDLDDTGNKPNDTGSKPGDTSSKPGSSSNNNSSNTSKPSSGNNTGSADKSTSGTNNSNDVYTGPIIKSNEPIEISYDLSSSQWDEVKAAYEAGYIKINDLDNNKLRIIKVSKDCGDTIWIVNDPRKLDSEEIKVFTVGSSLLEKIDYTNYDISESNWDSIYDDVSNGDAKIKLLDNTFKVIYPSLDTTDYVITINKK